MDKQKHTPGPWVHGAAGRTVEVWALSQTNLAKLHIAEVVYVDDDNSREETAANARLMSASPDLLEALQGAVRAMETVTLFPSFKPFIQRGKAAIAKATGQEAGAQ